MFIRSTVVGELGSADTLRDPRGLRLNFTLEGNFRGKGHGLRDPLKFPDFIHTQKETRERRRRYGILTFTGILHQVSLLMGDRGLPATFRHMHGYGAIHSLGSTQTPLGEKYHFRTDQGIMNMSAALAAELCGSNPFSTY